MATEVRGRGPVRTGRIGLLAVLLAASVLSGCGGQGTETTPGEPSPAPESPAAGRWTGLKAKCPSLTTKVAEIPEATGEGKPTPSYLDNHLALGASCSWGPGPGERPRIDASAIVFKTATGDKTVEQDAVAHIRGVEDRAEQRASGSEGEGTPPEAEPGLGDEAFVVLEPKSEVLSLTVRSGNAVVSVVLQSKQTTETDWRKLAERLRQQRPTIVALAKDVLEDLR